MWEHVEDKAYSACASSSLCTTPLLVARHPSQDHPPALAVVASYHYPAILQLIILSPHICAAFLLNLNSHSERAVECCRWLLVE